MTCAAFVAPTGPVSPAAAVGNGQELAHLLAYSDAIVVERLRAEHTAGPDGRCRACRSVRAVSPLWPCTLRGLADRAAELSVERGTPTGR
jgi:hypothetical protein